MTAEEFVERIQAPRRMTYYGGVILGESQEYVPYDRAGCDRQAFIQALTRSHREFTQLVGQRWFRGSPPATLSTIVDNLRHRQFNNNFPVHDPARASLELIGVLLMLPDFGVIE